MTVYDRTAVLHEVRRIVPDVQGVAVTGSAAFDGARFRADSDVDIVAIGPKSGFAWGRVGGHELEIETMHIDLLRGRVRNPQWHHTNWIWNIGKVGGAEVLFGPSLEDAVRSQITNRTRLIAGSTLIGALLNVQHKVKLGLRPQSLDVFEMNFGHFLVAIFAGRFIRFLIEALLTLWFGPGIVAMTANVFSHHLFLVLSIVGELIAAYFIWRMMKRRVRKKKSAAAKAALRRENSNRAD